MTERPPQSSKPSEPSRTTAGQAGRAYPGPHEFPFRFIDRVAPVERLGAGASDGTGDPAPGALPTAGFTVGATLNRSGGAGRAPAAPSLALLVEVMAQGALAALSGSGPAPDGASLRLAGVDDARLYSPVVPGDRLTVEAAVEGRFAALAKVACRLLRAGEPVAEAKLLLAGEWPGRGD